MARNNDFSRRVKELREARGLSKSELARLVGVTPTAVWNWEQSDLMPRQPTFSAVAKVFGLTETFLRTGVEGPEPAHRPAQQNVAEIIEQARNDIAACTGMAPSKVRVNVEFVSG